MTDQTNQEKRSTREIQEECAEIATQLDTMTHRLHWLREAVRLPPNAVELWEFPERAPWTVEMELVSAISTAVDEDLDEAALRLRKAGRVTDEQLRDRHEGAKLKREGCQP